MNLQQANLIEIVPVTTATSTHTGTGQDTQKYDGYAQFILTSAAGTGTSPTLDVKLQESDALGSGYTDIAGATFTQVTDAADASEMIQVDMAARKKYIRAVGTIAGTTPSFDFAVLAVSTRKAGRNASQLV